MVKTTHELSESQKYAATAQLFRSIDLETLRNSTSLADDFSLVFLREAALFPHRTSDGQFRLACADPQRREAIDAVLLTLPQPVELCLAKADEIDLMLDGIAHQDDSTKENFTSQSSELSKEEDINSLRDLASGTPVVKFLDDLFDRAVSLRATDIHIEPVGTEAQIRVRVDGMLRLLSGRNGSVAARALVSRVKILSNLNIAERRVPQDGRMRIKVRNRDFDLRVATMPTAHGEAAILRLLDRGSKVAEFDKLGFNTRDDALFRNALNLPHGMLIVTGPTGSGKTTTLAAALASLDRTSRKILTIEDPIEYQIAGVSQSQVRPAVGLTFASALRAFLRQDPDVIMVGEVRDSETAKIAIQAALTGHLVLTTLHTNTAAAAVTRLIDIGIESYLIASTLTAIMAQRLLRMLCADCKQSYVIDQKELDDDPRLLALDVKLGTTLFKAVGCERCGNSGFRGRRAIFEVLEITEDLRRLILSGADESALEKQARSEGMTTMIDDGREKCLAGLTTLDEVFRVAAFR